MYSGPINQDRPEGFLIEAAKQIADRGPLRDKEQERSMARCVNAFNAATLHALSERDGWVFMSFLKLARLTTDGGKYTRDDYVDGAAYMALAGECAANEESAKRVLSEKEQLLHTHDALSMEDLDKLDSQQLITRLCVLAQLKTTGDRSAEANDIAKRLYGPVR